MIRTGETLRYTYSSPSTCSTIIPVFNLAFVLDVHILSENDITWKIQLWKYTKPCFPWKAGI